MTPLGVWARRSLAVWTAPLVLGALVYGTWSRAGWQYEWLWGMRAVVVILPLVSPLVAAGVAFDVVRRWEPLLTTLGPSTNRWRRATLALVAAHVVWVFGCVCLVWVAVAARLSAHDAIWQADPWLPLEVLAALGAAAAVGFAIGMYVRGLAAPPLAAIVVFAIELLTPPYGLASLFVPMALVDSSVGLERDSRAAAMAVALNVAVSLWCGVVALRGTRPTRRWSAAVALLTAGFLGLVAVPPEVTPLEYRPTSSPDVCVVQGETRVCGPENARPHLRNLSEGLGEAVNTLKTSGLPFPQEYVLGESRLAHPRDRSAVVWVSPARLAGSQRVAALADVLSLPRVCPQLLEPNDEAIPLLDRQEQVRIWIRNALESGAGPAPPAIREAYHDLATCRLTA